MAYKQHCQTKLLLKVFSKLRIWVCIDTSSADVGSQMRNLGLVANARAIEMRCRCPPENS